MLEKNIGMSMSGAVDLSSLAAKHAAAGNANLAHPTESIEMSDYFIELNSDNFSEIIQISNSVPILVLFTVENHPELDEMLGDLKNIIEDLEGSVLLAIVNVEKEEKLIEAFGVQTIPTMFAVIASNPVPLANQILDKENLLSLCSQMIIAAKQSGIDKKIVKPTLEPKQIKDEIQEKIEKAISEKEYYIALGLYEEKISKDNKNVDAIKGKARVKLLIRLQHKDINEIRTNAANHSDNVENQLLVADLDISGGHVNDAFDRLLDLFASQAESDNKTIIKNHLIELFTLIGEDDSRVKNARMRLANLLF